MQESISYDDIEALKDARKIHPVQYLQTSSLHFVKSRFVKSRFDNAAAVTGLQTPARKNSLRGEFSSVIRRYHSYERAWIGSRAAAFAAGYQPKKIPTAHEKPIESTIDAAESVREYESAEATT